MVNTLNALIRNSLPICITTALHTIRLSKIMPALRLLVAGVFFLVLDTAISTPIGSNDQECASVALEGRYFGHHYFPNTECQKQSALDTIRLKQKYLDRLTSASNRIDRGRVVQLLDDLETLSKSENREGEIQMSCSACKATMETIRIEFDEGKSPEDILNMTKALCAAFHVLPTEDCDDLLDLYVPIITSVLQESALTAGAICEFVFNYECGARPVQNEWVVTLPSDPKPPLEEIKPPQDDTPKLKVLQISDTHFDVNYVEGSYGECRHYLCCRNDSIPRDANSTLAGKWGGWMCDSTERTLDNTLEHIAQQHPDIDYIIWTGDAPAHNLWEQSQETNLEVIKKTVSKLLKTFPTTPIFPAIGNHESFPANIYPPPGYGELDWLYDVIGDQWANWLPNNTEETVRRGAFYTTLARPGLRIVSMNMNYCYNLNWWLILNDTDPLTELKWLTEVLQSAEAKGEKVHIIGHVPGGHNDCTPMWQENYYKIINRYENTVRAQFFGHTHNDEFEVFYDLEDNDRPIAVGYLGPSVTTYTYLNPGYRIYYVDGDHNQTTRFVTDHETWVLDLEKANRDDQVVWSKLYTAREAYNMKSLLPQEWDQVYHQIANDNHTLEQYHRFYWKDSPVRPGYDEKWKTERLCDIRSCIRYKPHEN